MVIQVSDDYNLGKLCTPGNVGKRGWVGAVKLVR